MENVNQNKMKDKFQFEYFSIYLCLLAFLYHIGSIFAYEVINMKSQGHNGNVYDVIGNMTPQSIYNSYSMFDLLFGILKFIFCQLNWRRFALYECFLV